MFTFYHLPVINFAKFTAYALIALVLSSLATIPVRAEWVKTADGKSGTSYIDFVTISRNGHLAQIWHLQDLNQLGLSGEMSRQWLLEYDCRNNLLKVLAHLSYTGPMATGVSLVTQISPGSWTYIPDDSIAAGIVRKVCSAARV